MQKQVHGLKAGHAKAILVLISIVGFAVYVRSAANATTSCSVYTHDASGNRTSQSNYLGGGPTVATWGTGTWGCFSWSP